MSYSIVDVTKSLLEQGIESASFDVVVAVNVIHATPDVADVFENLFVALAPGGVVCAIEHVGTYRWDQMIWGLTPQWWLFEDSTRNGSPLMDLAQWKRAVKRLKLESFEWFPASPTNDVPDSRLLLLRPKNGAAGEHPVAMPLTEAQMELWLGVQLGPEASCSFNLPYRIELRGPLDVAALKEALQWLVKRHEALRMSFDLRQPISYLHPHAAVQLSVRSIAVDDPKQIDDLARMESCTPFEIDQAPLFRVQLLSVGKDHHIVLLTTHHLVCDGFSIRTLLKEFSEGYSLPAGRAPTAASPPKYTDYVKAQRKFDEGPEGETAEAHYLSMFSSLPEDISCRSIEREVGSNLFAAGKFVLV